VGSATLTRLIDQVDAITADEVVNGQPVREPVFYKGQWSKPGWYWMASVARHVSYESKFERSFLIAADFSGTVAEVLPQPLRLHFDRAAAPYRHVPDFLLAYRDGSRELVDIKGARARQKPVNRLTFTLTGRACDQLGWAFTVFTELAPAVRANVEFLAGFRGPLLAGLDDHAVTAVEVLANGPLPFSNLVEGLAAVGVNRSVAAAVVWRAVWQRSLHTDLQAGLFHSGTVIDLPETTISEVAT
jgi:hypothetical protein